MNDQAGGPDYPELSDEASAIWERISEPWNEEIDESGNHHTRHLIDPMSTRLLKLKPGEEALDIACGGGRYARIMAQTGANVVGADVAETFLNLAQTKSDELGIHVDFTKVDATDFDQIVSLGKERFDAVNCNQGLMNMASIQPLALGLMQILKPGGRFVFTVPHPMFNRVNVRFGVEQDPNWGEIRHTITTWDYLDATPTRGTGTKTQPEDKLEFDRPLAMLLNVFFEVGLVMDRMEEPVFPDEHSGSRPTSWAEYRNRKFPPHLGIRMIRPR